MSNRTKDLPPAAGPMQILRDLRYHEASRQGFAVILMIVFALAANPSVWSMWIGLPCAVLGASIRLYASGFISKNEELATNGPYALMRHPLYTGNILIVSAFALMAGQLWAVPLALFFFWFYYPPTVAYEDQKLHRLFGNAWQTWAARTPALIPAIGNLSAMSGGQWSLLRSMKRNGEPLIAAIVILCLYLVVRRLG